MEFDINTGTRPNDIKINFKSPEKKAIRLIRITKDKS